MRPEDLLETIGEAKDEYVQEADTPAPKKKKAPIIPIVGALAACLCLATVGSRYLPARSNTESAPADGNPEEVVAESKVNNESQIADTEGESPAESAVSMEAAAETDGSSAYEAYSLASPVYPEAISMPLYEDYFTEDLMSVSPSDGSDSANDEWNEKLEAANEAYNQAWDEYFEAERSQDTPRLTEDQKEDIISFATDTLPLLVEEGKEKNLAYSPVNLYYALTMVTETVDGKAQDDLLELVDVEEEELSDTLSKLWKSFYYDNGVSKTLIANSLWANTGFPLKQETLNKLAQDAYASSFQVEMGTDEANTAIASWLNKQTGNLLTEQTKSIKTNPDTALAIYSTIYYYDQWTSEFNQENNTFDTFTCGDKSEVEAEFMHKSTTSGFVRTDRYQFSSLGLKNSSATFVLPAVGVTPEELLKDEELWNAIFYPEELASNEQDQDEGLSDPSDLLDLPDAEPVEHYGIVNWSVPKFDISSTLGLKDALTDLGLGSLFDGSADFSPLSDEDLFISSITHSARILADEKGLSAAAYTELAYAGSGMPEDECDMILDRPFILIIEEQGVPLFIGIINTP